MHNNHNNNNNVSDQELSTPKPTRPRVVQKQISGNSTSGGPQGDTFHHRSSNSLQFSDLLNSGYNLHHHDSARTSPDPEHQPALPLESLTEEQDKYAGHANSNTSISSFTALSPATHHHHHHRKGVKSAGKKVLQVAVTRPWKSVKRRLIGGGARHDDDDGEHSSNSSYGALDGIGDDSLIATTSSHHHHHHRAVTSSSAAAGGDHSEISASSFPLLGTGSPLATSVRGFLNPVASLRDPATATATMPRSITPTESVLLASEYWLRCGVLLALAFMLGAHYQQHAWLVAKVAEYVLVAWLTCVVLRGTSAWNEVRCLQQTRAAMENMEVASVNDEHMPLLSGRDVHVRRKHEENQECSNILDEAAPLEHKCLVVEDHGGSFEVQRTQSFESSDNEEQANLGLGDDTQGATYSTKAFMDNEMIESDTAQGSQRQSVAHPSLNPFYIVNTEDNKRVFPNSSELMFPLDNDYFFGKMLALIRTPDVDDEYAEKGTEENDKASNYFSGRQRRFDFQFEFRVKKIPQGRIYFMIEVDEPVKMGMIQRAFASAALVRATYARLSANIVLAAVVIERC